MLQPFLATDYELLRGLQDRIQFVALLLASGEAQRGNIPHSGAVTEAQRRQKPRATQPFGPPSLCSRASLFAPHRSLPDMLVALASPWPKLPGGKLYSILESPQSAVGTLTTSRTERSYCSIDSARVALLNSRGAAQRSRSKEKKGFLRGLRASARDQAFQVLFAASLSVPQCLCG